MTVLHFASIRIADIRRLFDRGPITRSRSFPLGLGGFALKIRREGGTVFELDPGHGAVFTEPKKLAAILDKIAHFS